MAYDFSDLIAEIVDAKSNGSKVKVIVGGEKITVVSARGHSRDHNMVRIVNNFDDELVIHGLHIQAVIIGQN